MLAQLPAILCLAPMWTVTTADIVVVGNATIRHVAAIDVPQAPHGMTFSLDGGRLYVACAGADQVVIIDAEQNTVLGTLGAPDVPLDVMLAPDGLALITTRFSGDGLARLPLDGAEATAYEALSKAPSLFSPPTCDGRTFVVCEEADLVYELNASGHQVRSWETAARPYPADVTADGILLFVPARDDSVVTVIDTLNNREVARVAVGARPQGGALSRDDVTYIAACGGADELAFINTASFEIVDVVRKGVGPRPFAVTMAIEGEFGIVNNAGGNTVSILDVEARAIVGQLQVGEMPIVVRAHPDGRRIYVACEGDHTVHVLEIEQPADEPDAHAPKTEVLVLGMIHSGHRTSERYSLDVVKNLVRAIQPDDICTEIPPNRLGVALEQLHETGEVVEPRVRVFPEYVDAIFPLLSEMSFEIIATAGWTAEMNDYRRARLRQLAEDPERATQWQAHQDAMTAMNQAIQQIDGDDNPRVIHSDRYDEIIDQGLRGPYNEHFNDDLADGGWDNINAKHYALIAGHLDRIRGQGRRVLITYGSGHKGWFLRQLRQRNDVVLVDVGPFLDAIGAP